MRTRYTIPCVNEGAILEWCNTCNGESKHVRECDIHEKCTRGYVSHKVQACIKCTEYQPDTETIKTQAQQTTPEEKARKTMEREELKSKILAKVLEDKQKQEEQKEQSNKTILTPIRSRRLLLRERAKERINQGVTLPVTPVGQKNTTQLAIQSNTNRYNWVCAVTTVPQRRNTLLADTLFSLRNSGFPDPHLFIDVQGETYLPDIVKEYTTDFQLPFTIHSTNIRAFGNWYLALMEMMIRYPRADRYAFFQDDIVCCKNLREYLDHCAYPDKGYINLMTFPQNEDHKANFFSKTLPEEKRRGWYPSNQRGKSASGYVFDRNTLLDILENGKLIRRSDSAGGWHNIDGGLSGALRPLGYLEYVHSPSLIGHKGTVSSMESAHTQRQPDIKSFLGDEWDAMDMLNKNENEKILENS